ncbi:hypothetical protein [Streptomyces sp. NPDC047976]
MAVCSDARLDPVGHRTDAMADRLIAWWAAVGPVPDGEGTPEA